MNRLKSGRFNLHLCRYGVGSFSFASIISGVTARFSTPAELQQVRTRSEVKGNRSCLLSALRRCPSSAARGLCVKTWSCRVRLCFSGRGSGPGEDEGQHQVGAAEQAGDPGLVQQPDWTSEELKRGACWELVSALEDGTSEIKETDYTFMVGQRMIKIDKSSIFKWESTLRIHYNPINSIHTEELSCGNLQVALWQNWWSSCLNRAIPTHFSG